ncbi:putative tRNA pseudouridine synthase 1 [Blattamonas nauphoetae]|uniref:tRNA pseudouridine synthase 1 n=1 Tax=Blattamonas nauphoetae TaxID=2049346 RepID=A0ABQ9YLA1_9EUKA|nr:putative tRNA pseudouridine synthase 1 [Blattamonas nauphoetae]
MDISDTTNPESIPKPNSANETTEKISIPKRRVCLCFGYLGSEFSGLQVNPGARTVESELEAAIVTAGGISPVNAGSFTKVGWGRCARTDKGVHATAQIVSLKMLLSEPDTLVQRINAALPPSIRVFAMLRTTEHFNPKSWCSGRTYRYLIPTFVFDPSSFADVSEMYPWAKDENMPLIDDVESDGEGGDDSDDDKPKKRRKEKTPIEQPPAQATDPGNMSEYFPQKNYPKPYLTHEQSIEYLQTTRKQSSQFEWSDELSDKVNEVAKRFVGTRNYHNYTTAKAQESWNHCNRVIRKIKCSKAFTIDGLEMVEVTLDGQSFIYHQIRKMIGAIICVIRGTVPSDFIDLTFSERAVPVPLAPSVGLFLDRCHFDQYNKKFAGDSAHPQLIFNQPEIESFVTSSIHPHIAHSLPEWFLPWLESTERVYPSKLEKALAQPAPPLNPQKIPRLKARERELALIAKSHIPKKKDDAPFTASKESDIPFSDLPQKTKRQESTQSED